MFGEYLRVEIPAKTASAIKDGETAERLRPPAFGLHVNLHIPPTTAVATRLPSNSRGTLAARRLDVVTSKSASKL